MSYDDPIDGEPGELDTDHVTVRGLTLDDLDAVVRIDKASTGLQRQEFYRTKISRSIEDSSVHVSLAAELDDMVVGFVSVTMYFGEFGRPEATAVLDAIGVHPEYRGRKVAKAIMRQLEMNLGALGVETLRTEVSWDHFDLLAFLKMAGFSPAPRVSLAKSLNPDV